MGACCSCKVVELQPGKVHYKKTREIFKSYLKNQGIKESIHKAGRELITPEVAENVERHSRAAAKDLVALMQIDKQFIKRVCTLLTRKMLDFDQSTELQYLSIVLLKELIQTPLAEKASRPNRQTRIKQQMQKFNTKVKGRLGDFSSINKGHTVANKQTSPEILNEVDFYQGLEDQPQTGKRSKISLQTLEMTKSQNNTIMTPRAGRSHSTHNIQRTRTGFSNVNTHEQYREKLQDIQSKEFEFCVQNQKLILETLQQVICYYNYDLKQSDGNASIPQQNQNTKYFSQVCLDIIDILLDNIQKSQLLESEDIYFDLLTNFLYKSRQDGIYGVMGLDPLNPYADGLEPLTATRDGSVQESQRVMARLPLQFSYGYLHNNSQTNVQNNKMQQPYLTECQKQNVGNEFRLQSYNSFFKIVKIMREQTFASSFPQIFEHVWCLIKLSQDSIQQLGSNLKERKNSDILKTDQKTTADADQKDEYFEQLIQLGFDIFQYLVVKISSDQILDLEEQYNLFMHGIFQYFNKRKQWQNFKFSEFIFVLMIFNGGKTRIDGQIGFMEFYEVLQKYNDNKLRETIGGPQVGNNLSIVDQNMLDKIIENLFRMLMDDLHRDQKVEAEFLNNKIKLMKVLFEMINLVETPHLDSEETIGISPSNIVLQKLQQDSALYVQIFVDLATFLSCQGENISLPVFEQFWDHIQQLIEIFLFKTQQNPEVLQKAIDFVMCSIQVKTSVVLKNIKNEKSSQNLNLELNYLMKFCQIILYFIQENLKQLQVGAENQNKNPQVQFVPNQQSGVSPSLKGRMSVKMRRNTIVGTSSSIIGTQNLFLHETSKTGGYGTLINKLKGDYQIYMLQLIQVISLDSAFTANNLEISVSETMVNLSYQLAAKEQLTINALNIDLQLKNINNMIKIMKRQKQIKRSNSTVKSVSVFTMQNYSEKPIIYYKFKNKQAESENYNKSILDSLLNQNEIHTVDQINLYLYTLKKNLFDNLLQNKGKKDGNFILVFENWLALVQGSLYQRCIQETGAIHYMSFLIILIDEINNFCQENKEQQDARSSARSPQEKLELQIKVKALFIYMIYGFLHIFYQQESFEMQGLSNLLENALSKIENTTQFASLEDIILQLPHRSFEDQKNKKTDKDKKDTSFSRRSSGAGANLDENVGRLSNPVDGFSKFQLKQCYGGQNETCESMSVKFQQLLSCDIRILDQVISDQYKYLIGDLEKNSIVQVINSDIQHEESEEGLKGSFTHVSLSEAKEEILIFTPSQDEKVKLLGIELIPNHHGNLKMIKADSLGQLIPREQNESQDQIKTIDLNSKFDIKNFQDVYVSENGSKYDRESSVPSDRGVSAANITASEANIETSPVRKLDDDQPYLEVMANQQMQQRSKLAELIQLESCSSLSSSMLDVTKNINNNQAQKLAGAKYIFTNNYY